MSNKNLLMELLQHKSNEDSPCISIYTPTHRHHPDNEVDPIKYKNTLSDVERELEQHYTRRDYAEMLEALQRLTNQQTDLWQYTKDGLAVFANDDFLRIVHLDKRAKPLSVVSDHFHVLPLFAYLENDGNVFVVDLGKDRIDLFQSTRHADTPYQAKDVKQSMNELFDDFDNESDLNVGSYGGLDPMHHGHRARPEEVEKDRKKYFRYLDRALTSKSKKQNMPILLAGTTENIAAFRDLAKGDVYLEADITQPYDSLSEDEKRAHVNKALQPVLQAENDAIATRLQSHIAEGKTETNDETLLAMAGEGRLAELVINLQALHYGNTNLDQLVQIAASTGTVIRVFEDGYAKTNERVIGLLRY